LVATAASALGRPQDALATDGQPIIQGANNAGSASTVVRSNNNTALQGVADQTFGAVYGVRGRTSSPAGAGVFGTSFATVSSPLGVLGTAADASGIGVKGEGGAVGVEGSATSGDPDTAGVYGHVNAERGAGVVADNDFQDSGAVGLIARSNGIGLYAEAGAPTGAVGVLARVWTPDGVAIKGLVNSGGPGGIGLLGVPESTDSSTRGVVGVTLNGCGVEGWSGSLTPQPAPANTGVSGQCDTNAQSAGVAGSSASGIGLRGQTNTGTAVSGIALDPAATGLRVIGKAVFSRSGKATVPAGQTSVAVTNVALTGSSMVLATIQGFGEANLYIKGVSMSIADSRFTIRLSKAPTGDTKVGWFIVN
jgi:hypothetical protein